jgi:hypothetical protein
MGRRVHKQTHVCHSSHNTHKTRATTAAQGTQQAEPWSLSSCRSSSHCLIIRWSPPLIIVNTPHSLPALRQITPHTSHVHIWSQSHAPQGVVSHAFWFRSIAAVMCLVLPPTNTQSWGRCSANTLRFAPAEQFLPPHAPSSFHPKHPTHTLRSSQVPLHARMHPCGTGLIHSHDLVKSAEK